MPDQFSTWLVCQFCGRTSPADDAEHWLNQPHRERWDVRVVRCPEHWSEWALRHTREGRTKDNRARMKEALSQPPPPIPPSASPFPVLERDDPGPKNVRI
jgi:hypothetical protein